MNSRPHATHLYMRTTHPDYWADFETEYGEFGEFHSFTFDAPGQAERVLESMTYNERKHYILTPCYCENMS